MRHSLKKISFVLPVVFYSFSCAWANCKVPNTLAGQILLTRVSSEYLKNNPNAGEVMKLSFNKDGSYINTYLTKDKQYKGTYEYKKINDSTSLFSAQENFEGKITRYEFWLHCANNVSGKYIYKQEDGAIAPQVRLNTGDYSIDRN